MSIDPSIRELAENPNVYQPLTSGRELLTDPEGRFAIYLGAGTGPHSATVQRVRLGQDDVEPAVEEIRALLRDRGRGGAEWELGESCTPADLVERLGALGIMVDADEPSAIGMVLAVGHRRPGAGRRRRRGRSPPSTSSSSRDASSTGRSAAAPTKSSSR